MLKESHDTYSGNKHYYYYYCGGLTSRNFAKKSATPKNVTPYQTFTIKWVTLIHVTLF